MSGLLVLYLAKRVRHLSTADAIFHLLARIRTGMRGSIQGPTDCATFRRSLASRFLSRKSMAASLEPSNGGVGAVGHGAVGWMGAVPHCVLHWVVLVSVHVTVCSQYSYVGGDTGLSLARVRLRQKNPQNSCQNRWYRFPYPIACANSQTLTATGWIAAPSDASPRTLLESYNRFPSVPAD